MNSGRTGIFWATSLLTLLICVAFAGVATAAPAWKFNGKALEGEETLLSHDTSSGFTVPGVTTTCNPFVYDMTIKNVAGTGVGSITALPLSNCSTDGVCSVDAVEAAKLPWAAKLTGVGGNPYMIIEGIKLSFLYGGDECALDEFWVPITGSAGGLINNSTEAIAFNASTFKTTGTALKALGSSVEWNGVFLMAALGAHKGQALTVS